MPAFLTFLFFSLIPRYNNHALVDGVPAQLSLEMLSLCNTFSLSHNYPNCNALVPIGYRKKAQTAETPLLNIVHIYKKKNTLVLVFRGTIDATNSWLENVHFMQIPAKDKIQVNKVSYPYNFSEKVDAAVHSGYVLANTYLWELLKEHLNENALSGIDQIILTGHSQGGALAQLFHAQMNLMDQFSDIQIMSFSFGSPRIGNQSFTDDFNQRFRTKNLSFRFVNPTDIVPNLPLLNKSFEANINGQDTNIDLETMKDLAVVGLEFLPSKYKKKLDSALEVTKIVANGVVTGKIGDVVFPSFSSTVFYGETGKMIRIEPLPYPDFSEDVFDEDMNEVLAAFNLLQAVLASKKSLFQHSNFTYYNAIHEHFKPLLFRRVNLSESP